MISMSRKQAARKQKTQSFNAAVSLKNHGKMPSMVANSADQISVSSRIRRLTLSKPAAAVRRKIESLDQRIDLPIARKALGLLEGDHPSHKRFGNGDVIDIHAWQPGDEARMMNWSASARSGQPMVSSRERTSSSQTWIVMDASINMNGACNSQETLYEVASNVACFFALLSLKRHDAVSLLCADGDNLLTVKAARNLSDFERNLDCTLFKARRNARNIEALITATEKTAGRNNLIVFISDEYAIKAHHTELLKKLTQTHQLIVVSLCPVNPCDQTCSMLLHDGVTLRKIPAFLQNQYAKKEIEARREMNNNALHDMLLNAHTSLICGKTSEEVFHAAAKVISQTSTRSVALLRKEDE